MPTLTINVSTDLFERINDWSIQSHLPAQQLAVELLEEYFDDCDDADRLEALIRSGDMQTYPAETVHKELNNLAAVAR